MYGRGACDAKGIAASMVCAAERLRDEDAPVALLFVVGEEVTHDGAHAANEAFAGEAVPATSRVIINGEPTESTLALGTKGAVRVIVRTDGTGRALRLSASRPVGDARSSCTCSPSSTHRVADGRPARRDDGQHRRTGRRRRRQRRRAVGRGAHDDPPRHRRRSVERIIERWADGRASLEWGPMVPPVKLGVVDGFKTSVAAFATDIPALTNWGTPYLFGPGSIHVAHRDDEHIAVDELRAAVERYVRLVRAASDVIPSVAKGTDSIAHSNASGEAVSSPQWTRSSPPFESPRDAVRATTYTPVTPARCPPEQTPGRCPLHPLRVGVAADLVEDEQARNPHRPGPLAQRQLGRLGLFGARHTNGPSAGGIDNVSCCVGQRLLSV